MLILLHFNTGFLIRNLVSTTVILRLDTWNLVCCFIIWCPMCTDWSVIGFYWLCLEIWSVKAGSNLLRLEILNWLWLKSDLLSLEIQCCTWNSGKEALFWNFGSSVLSWNVVQLFWNVLYCYIRSFCIVGVLPFVVICAGQCYCPTGMPHFQTEFCQNFQKFPWFCRIPILTRLCPIC